VIGEDGRLTDAAPERFAGLSVPDAQRAVVAELREQGLIARSEEYHHTVPFSHRSGERIEPLISLQWFMRMGELARPAIEVVKTGQVRFHPGNYERVYLEWMENIRPWCISRQLWWGHRIPVWYRGEEVFVGESEPEGEGWERDPDVLDTWFSSALWPFATLGWPADTPELRAFYPTDVNSTARDIIFLWVARMIMMGIEFTGQVPFTDVNIHSIIQAPDGRRMSKSLGTGIDPIDLIEGGPRPPVFVGGGDFPAYGADAVRWGLAAMSSGQDVAFSEDRIAQGQQLTNKLWNAARLILLGVQSTAAIASGDSPGAIPPSRTDPEPTRVEDRWILSRLHRAKTEVSGRIERFDFSHAALALYDFVYGELCDWYLELIKPRLRAGEPELAATLLYVLTETLALAHPMIPFVTEEIYSYVPGAEGLLAAGIPEHDGTADEAAEASLAQVIEAVQALRAWRNAAGVKAGATMPARLSAGGYAETGEHLARLARLAFSEPDGSGAPRSGEAGCRAGARPEGEQPVASVPVPGGTIEILANEHLDLEASERKRAAQRAQLEMEVERSERKLANQGFVDKAPPQVVEAERAKLERLREELAAL
jgi:valyl-tRNA synthetase